MLPSKGYFNSLECPFYLSPTKCLRPYCHFKHPKRNPAAVTTEPKIENYIEDKLVDSTHNIISAPVVEKPIIAPVKHIPIAYIPTKPSAISVNTKKPKNVYVPSTKNATLSQINPVKSVDYDPSTIMDSSSEKTYSRYSYEKGHDSGDEIMENHKNLIETNQIGKYDDGSKSGYDEETDDYPEEPEFSPSNSPVEDDLEDEQPIEELDMYSMDMDLPKPVIEPEPKEFINKSIKCKKKRKYADINEIQISLECVKNNGILKDKVTNDKTDKTYYQSKSVSPKRIKVEENDNVKIKKVTSEEHDILPAKSIKVEDDPNHSMDCDTKKPEKKVCKYKGKKYSSDSVKNSENKHRNETDKKKLSSDSKKHSDRKHSKSDEKRSNKTHSSDHKKQSPDNAKKQESQKKASSSDSKKSSSETSRTHSRDQKKSADKKKSEKETHLSAKKSSDKKHSSDNHCKKSSSSDKNASESKKSSSSRYKKKENEKYRSSSKNKEHSSSNKSSSKKHSTEDNKKHMDKKKNLRNSESSSKKKHEQGKNSKNKLHSRESESNKSIKRKHSDSSDSVISTHEKKETILISDSSDSELNEINLNHSSPVDIDDIFGSSDSGEDSHFTNRRGNYHDVSDSDNDLCNPSFLSGSKERTSCRSSSLTNNRTEEEMFDVKQNFKTAPQTNADDYKPAQSTSKIRIAHVPNVSSLLSAKTLISTGKTVPPAVQKIITSVNSFKTKTSLSRTTVQNASTSRPKPQVTTNLNSIVAINIRQPGLNNIYDELIKFVDYDEAYHRAVEEELEICNVATNPHSYRNRIALCILRIRKSKGAVDIVQKELITSNSTPDYTYGLTLYECFSKYLLKPEEYVVHGYPLEIPDKPNCAYIDKKSFYRNKHVDPMEGSFRKCINCGKEYAVDEETGIPLMKNNCHHHWGKLIGMRQGKIYSCCKSEVGSDPCHTSVYHVTELKNEDCLKGFVKTQPYPIDADINKAGIYAMDCEMCFTTKGRDIVRASLLAVDNESVYDVLIKPKHPILDYCTRFSGITEEKLESVTTTLEDVQRFLLRTINDKTILVGHSLENDLKALKLMHYNVVDTSVMFPHKEGLPVKCALRTLCSRILGTAIQTGENGHDSLEDARGCLQLVLHQVRDDAKSRKPRVVKQLKTTK